MCFACIPFVFSQSVAHNSITLLAVSELEDGRTRGSIATLELEIIPGRGRVFLDTFPLTQVDTQVSTRIAKEIACQISDVSCDEFDFIYTITSGSSIIGGPSAGAAITALTVLTLENERILPRVTITGTSNTGGLIGPVGGLQEKIQAASRNGIQTVLIPRGERHAPLTNDTSNQSVSQERIDLVAFGLQRGVSVIEVGNIFEVLTLMSRRDFSVTIEEVEIPTFYRETMFQLADAICQRTDETIQSIHLQNLGVRDNSQDALISLTGLQIEGNTSSNIVLRDSQFNITFLQESILDLLNQSQNALERSDYYSAASFCFGAGINARFLASLQTEFSELETMAQDQIQRSLTLHRDSYTTIVELQTFMLVSERIAESEEHLEAARELYAQNNTPQALFRISQSIERAFSAESWASFYQPIGQEFRFDVATLSQGCSIKLREAQDRQNFVSLYAPFLSESTILETAREHQREGRYELCLFEASKAKARFDVVLGKVGVSTQADFADLIAEREVLVRHAIDRQIEKEIFPIIGYSYFEYALSLVDIDPQSSLLYLQFALGLSNLDVYFPKESSSNSFLSQSRFSQIDFRLIFFFGLALGMIVAVILLRVESLLSRLKQRKSSLKTRSKPARARQPKSSRSDRKKR